MSSTKPLFAANLMPQTQLHTCPNADAADLQTVAAASKALWLSMEQSFDCRTDFRKAAGPLLDLHSVIQRIAHNFASNK
jgi:hypothetical protein